MVERLQVIEESFDRKRSEEETILKLMTAAVKQLEKRVCLLQDKTGLILKTYEMLMER